MGLFDSDGVLDPSFGSAGVVRLRTAFGLAGEELRGIYARPEGGVGVIVNDTLASPYGESGVGRINFGSPFGETDAHSGSFVVGLTSTGQLDPSYGSGGVIRLDDELVVAFHSLSDGSLLVSGDRWGPAVKSDYDPHESDLFLTRYTPAGQPDPTFGVGGSAVVDFGGIDLTRAALWESDGSVLLGGGTTAVHTSYCMNFSNFCLETPVLARFTPNGHLDPNFGTGGLLMLTAFNNPFGDLEGSTGVTALSPREGGGVLAGGGSGTVAFIAALEPSGALNPSFGSDAGFITETEPSRSRTEAHAIAIDDKGRMLVAGATDADRVTYGPEAAVFRYLPNGAIDQSFGEGAGYVRVPGEADQIAVEPDGSSYVLSGRFLPAVTSLTPSGQIDRHFGEEGTVSLPARLRGMLVEPESIAVLPGGDVVVAASGAGADSRIAIFRLRPDGSLDRSFGRHGIAFPPVSAKRYGVNQMAVEPDGRIVMAGYLQDGPINHVRLEAPILVRLLPDGALDRSFGRRGIVVSRVGRHSFASSLAIVPGGGILVAGRARLRSHYKELLFRYTPAGRLDRSFAHQGVSTNPAPSTRKSEGARPRQVLIADHHILVLRDDRYRELLVYSRDGRLEDSFVVARSTEPKNRGIRAPFGALQRGRLILGWQVFHTYQSFKLQRLTIG